MLRFISSSLLLLFGLTVAAAGQQNQINPNTQVKWFAVPGCLTAGNVFSPATGACIPVTGGSPAAPNQIIQRGVGSVFSSSGIFAAGNEATLQTTITAAGTTGSVTIPANYTGTDTFTNPNGIPVNDLRVDVPVNARNVKEFGARCDGVTDDSAAIQSAFDFAYTHTYSTGIGLTFPLYSISFPAGTCYIATPISYRGESFFGVSTTQSIIKGPLHNSIFVAPDMASSPAKKCCFPNAQVHDITLLVDTATDANTAGTLTQQQAWAAQGQGAGQGSIFANYYSGWIGQTVMGSVTAAATSIPLTSVLNLNNFHSGVATDGWVKVGTEYMYYHGLSNTSCPNAAPSCLLNVQRGITVAGLTSTAAAITGGASIAPINPLAPANVTDWIPAWTIGACAFVFPAKDGLHTQGVPFEHGWLEHINISAQATTTWPAANACGIYIQGSFYGGKISHWYQDYLSFGFVMAPPFTNTDAYLAAGVSSDNMVFDDLDINATNPYITFLGGKVKMSGLTFYAGSSNLAQAHGMSIYQLGCHTYGGCQNSELAQFNITGLYEEINNGGNAITMYPPSQQIGGFNHVINGYFMGSYAPLGIYPIVWDASNSTVGNVDFGTGLPALQINGNNNGMLLGNVANQVVDNGIGNSTTGFTTQYGYRSMNAAPTRSPAIQLSTDFLKTGSVTGDWYESPDDLFFTPEDFNNNPTIQTVGNTVVNDPTAPVSGRYSLTASATGTINMGSSLDGNNPRTVGNQFPKGTGIFYVALKATSGSPTQFWQAVCGGQIGSATFTLSSTAWAIYQFPYNASGCALGANTGFSAGATSNSTAVEIAWADFMPNFDTVNVTGAVNAGSLAVTGNGTVGGNLAVTGTLTAGTVQLAPLTLLTPGLNQTALTLNTSSLNLTNPILNIESNGVSSWQINKDGSMYCPLTICYYTTPSGGWAIDSYGNFKVNGSQLQVGGNAVQIANSNPYSWSSFDATVGRGGVGLVTIGSSYYSQSNGSLQDIGTLGSYVLLNQVVPYATMPTMALTGAAGAITASYYGCYFDAGSNPIGCTPVNTVTNAPTTPTSSNYYQALSGQVAGAFYSQICRMGGYATHGLIGTRSQGGSSQTNDTTGTTFLPGDGSTCPLANTSTAGIVSGPVTDQAGAAGVSKQWADLTNQWPSFNANNTGKKYDVGIAAAALGVQGHAAVFAANGKDVVDGGGLAVTSATGGAGVTSVTCNTAACTNLRGTYTVVGGTFATGTVVTLVWAATPAANVCQVIQNGGATYLGLGHAIATTTGIAFTNAVTVTGVTFTFDYECTP